MQKNDKFIKDKVNECYKKFDYNCATTTLLTLSEYFNFSLHQQTIDSALGMHGAGKYGAQCGLVEGTLMFLGMQGREKKLSEDMIIKACNKFAREFENYFSSLQCKVLRPEGFHPEQPPHLCESITCSAINFSINYIKGLN